MFYLVSPEAIYYNVSEQLVSLDPSTLVQGQVANTQYANVHTMTTTHREQLAASSSPIYTSLLPRNLRRQHSQRDHRP